MPAIDHQTVRALCQAIFEKLGSLPGEAKTIADNLVEANLAGHDSHGVALVPIYAGIAEAGHVTPNQHVRVVKDTGGILITDGGRGYGQVIAAEAMALAIDRAKANGVTVLSLRNAHHIGRVGAWGEMAAEAGLVSMHYANVMGVDAIVAPYRGSDARFGTNPYCCAIPGTDKRPMVLLDMATSRIAMGKVLVAFNKGEALAPGMIVDDQGQPATDPGLMVPDRRGALLPFGEHKGYGLALICELLAGVVGGGGTIQPGHDAGGGIINGMLAILIDPGQLVDRSFFEAELEAYLDHVEASPPAKAQEPVLIPGDPERLRWAERAAHGVPLDDGTWTGILETARRLGVDGTLIPDQV